MVNFYLLTITSYFTMWHNYFKEKGPDLYRTYFVWRYAAEGAGAGRSLLRNDPSENRFLYEGCQRESLEAWRYREDTAQRGRSGTARAGDHLL